MTLHPLLLALTVADVLAVAAVLVAAVTAARVATGWAPGAPTRAQLALERRVEAASMQGRAAFWLLVAGTALLAVAVASTLPSRVPGAMCGTGVMDAMGGLGERALILRGLALAALGAWHLIDRLDRRAPSGPLAPGAARALLVATPLVLLAAWDTLRATSALDVETSVSCCAAVYEVASGAAGSAVQGEGPGWLPFALGAAVLVVVGLALAASRRVARSRVAPWLLAAVALAWAPIAALFLVEELAAYHYEVLDHHCPWCLFLGEHGGVGYLLFGALAVIALEGPAAAIAAVIARRARDGSRALERRLPAASTSPRGAGSGEGLGDGHGHGLGDGEGPGSRALERRLPAASTSPRGAREGHHGGREALRALLGKTRSLEELRGREDGDGLGDRDGLGDGDGDGDGYGDGPELGDGPKLGNGDGVLAEAAVARTRRAGLAVALAALVFVGVAAWPAVSWVLTHGLWIR